MSGLERVYIQLVKMVNSVLSCMRILLLSKKRGMFSLPICHKELVILGNGPSLRSLLASQRSFLEGKDLLMVNFSALSEDYEKLRPRLYLLMDPIFFEDSAAQQKLFVPLVEKTNWELHLFVPVSAGRYTEWQEMVGASSFIRIHWFNATAVEGVREFNYFCFRNKLGMPRPRNVLIPCLMVSMGLSYKIVYLAGADHSWMKEIWVDDRNVVYEDMAHFYDKKSTELIAIPRKLHDILENMSIAFRAYHEIEGYSAKRGTKIVNITPGSYIDAFERISLESLVPAQSK